MISLIFLWKSGITAVKAFEEHKKQILSKLTEMEDIELVEEGLGFSGISFIKAVKEYLYKGINCLEEKGKLN